MDAYPSAPWIFRELLMWEQEYVTSNDKLPLEVWFSGSETLEMRMLDLLGQARRRIIYAFDKATEIRLKNHEPDRWPTENYIHDSLDDLDGLAKWIADKVTLADMGFVERHHLPAHLARGASDPESPLDIIQLVQFQLILHQLESMAAPNGAEIWYDHHRRYWQMSQSCIDERTRERNNALPSHKRRPCKDDRRPYHGRPARDRDRLIPGGQTSIGGTIVA